MIGATDNIHTFFNNHLTLVYPSFFYRLIYFYCDMVMFGCELLIYCDLITSHDKSIIPKKCV